MQSISGFVMKSESNGKGESKGKGKGKGKGEGKVKAKEEREGEGKGKVEGRVNICQLIQLKQNKNVNWIKTLLEQFDPINF